MSIIQTIRDRGAKIAVFLIALALIGFILTDYLTGRSSSLFSSGPGTTMGKINGEKINYNDFSRKVDIAEKNKQDNEPLTETVNKLWADEVNRVLVAQECEKLGITVGDKEIQDMIFGAEPHPYIRQFFYGQSNDPYDPSAVSQAINQLNKTGTPEQKAEWETRKEMAINDRLVQKYKNVIAGSIHYPKWMLEKQNVDNSLLAKLSYVFIPANSLISDSSKDLAVSDKEISEFIKKRKEFFTIPDELRSIEYVRFNAIPSQADSTKLFGQMVELKDSFARAKNVEVFLTRNGSAIFYDSNYHTKTKTQVPGIDSAFFKIPKDSVYGPYVDASSSQSNYVLAKLLDVRSMPDSVKARHIMVQTADPSTGRIILDDSTAKKRIDSIELALKNGARFDSLAKKLSDDKGSGMFGGLLRMPTQTGDTSDYFTQGQMVKEFNDSCFMGKAGDIKKVKTAAGYHLVEILDQRHFELNYKIAYMARNIQASEETDQSAANNAFAFAGEAKDYKSFEKTIQDKKYQKLSQNDINEHGYQVADIISRDFVREVFKADRNKVMKTQTLQDNKKNNVYIVAVVTEINKPGLISVAKARQYVEPELRKIKKAAIIKKEIGTPGSLEAVANALNSKYHPADTIKIATEDSLRFNPQRSASRIAGEQRLLGVAFNPANNGKLISEAIIGNSGSVYVAKVDNVTATTVENADVNAQRKAMEAQSRQSILFSFSGFGQQGYDPAAVLRKVATIKDYRTKFNY
jgi:peptidyl-prolyl cis-trans isomerase D